jgi:PAS domain S-box-containing protein
VAIKIEPIESLETPEVESEVISEPVVEGLSEREKEVLFLAGEGLTDKEIAIRLQIGPKTVRTYWDRMRAKLNAASRTEVLAKALRAAYDDLARTELRLRMFVEHMPVLFCAVNAGDGAVIVNEEFARLTGQDKDSLVHDPDLLARVLPDADTRSRVLCRFPERSEDFRDLEAELVCEEGVRSVEWTTRARENPIAGWTSWAIGVDATERNRAKEALRNSEAALRRLLESSEQGVWIIDSDQNTTFVNQRLADMFGTTTEELMSSGTNYLEGGDSAELVREMLLGGGGRVTYTQKFAKRDKTDLWATVSVNPLYSDTGEVHGYAAVLTDISQKKNLERQLKSTKQAYGTLLNHTSDQVLRFNRDLACVYANFELMKGNPGDSVMVEGRSWEEVRRIIHPQDEWLDGIRHVFDTGQRVWIDQCRVGVVDQRPKCAVLLPEPGSQPGSSYVLALVSANSIDLPAVSKSARAAGLL